MYGLTKCYLEQLGAYYRRRFDVDFRSLRCEWIDRLMMQSGECLSVDEVVVEIFGLEVG